MPDDELEFTIGVVSQRCGVTLRALRFYEDRGLLRPRKAPNRERFYTEADVARIEYVLQMQRFGFTLREIEAILFGYPTGILPRLSAQQVVPRLQKLKQQREELDRTIDELRALEVDP